MAVIAHYKLNDNAASSTVVDDTGVHDGNYKDGGGNINTSTGDTANSRGVGTCLDFDGDEYIEIADHVDFSPGDGTEGSGTPFSISAWVYMHDAADFWIVSKGKKGTLGEYRLGLDANKVMAFSIFDDSLVNCEVTRYYNVDLSIAHLNQWIHFVVTYDGGASASSLKIYMNAVRVDDSTYIGGPTFVAVENLTAPVHIGRYHDKYANGLIDNVIFFNQELNLDEVKALYHGGHGTEIVEVIDLDRRIQRRQ